VMPLSGQAFAFSAQQIHGITPP